MLVTETLADGLKRIYTVVVPGADIEGLRAAKLDKLGRTLRLPGFRPGKVPMPVVRQRFGGAVMAEVVEESIDLATRQMLSERGLRPADRPQVAVLSPDPAAPLPAGPAADLEFAVAFEVLPDIVLPDFAAIALTRYTATPDPEQVDQALAEIASRNAPLVDVEPPRPARAGDTLVVDYVGRIGETEFSGGTGTDMAVTLGAGGFIPGFAEQMEGMQPGEQRSIEVTFPAEYGVKDLAGKQATFAVTAKVLRERTAAVADDALAVRLGATSLEHLRSLVTGQMQREYDQFTRQRIKRALLDALAERAQFSVPDSMVETEFNRIWPQVQAALKGGTADAEDRGKDEATLRHEYRAIAARRVRLGLLMSEIGRVHGIVVSNEEMTPAIRREAARYTGQEQQALEFFRKTPQAVEGLRSAIFEDKVVDFLLELATVEVVQVSPDELGRDTDAEPEPPEPPVDLGMVEQRPEEEGAPSAA